MSDIRQLDITADHAIQLDVPANTTALVTVNGGSTLYYSDADRTVAVATAQGSIVLNGSQTFTSPVWAKPASGLTSITVLSTPITTPIGSLPVGVANGIAGLDGNAALSTDQIPVSVESASPLAMITRNADGTVATATTGAPGFQHSLTSITRLNGSVIAFTQDGQTYTVGRDSNGNVTGVTTP